MTVPPPSDAVRALVERQPPDRIQRIDINGRPAWLKRRAPAGHPPWQRPLRRWFERRYAWMPLDEPPSDRILREARRMIALRATGSNVPEVIAATADWILTEDCGPTARQVVRGLAPAARQALLEDIAGDLGRLHAAGHWHGGAEIKNTTLLDGVRYRIDFEVGFPPTATLVEIQGRDAFLFLMSCADLADATALATLLRHYLDAGGPADALACAAATLQPYRSAWQDLLPGGDVRRGRAAADALIASAAGPGAVMDQLADLAERD